MDELETNVFSDDTIGSLWIDISEIHEESVSLLILTAKEFIETSKIEIISIRYDGWEVRKEAVWEIG